MTTSGSRPRAGCAASRWSRSNTRNFLRFVVWVRPMRKAHVATFAGGMLLVAVSVSVLSVLGGRAWADKFGDATGQAKPLAGASDVAGLFWSTTVECAKSGSDLE